MVLTAPLLVVAYKSSAKKQSFAKMCYVVVI